MHALLLVHRYQHTRHRIPGGMGDALQHLMCLSEAIQAVTVKGKRCHVHGGQAVGILFQLGDSLSVMFLEDQRLFGICNIIAASCVDNVTNSNFVNRFFLKMKTYRKFGDVIIQF